MRIVALATAVLISGCSESDIIPSDAVAPVEETAPECTLHTVDVVLDNAETMGGFDSAPQSWISEMAGKFTGPVETPYGSLEGELSVDYNIGEVLLVTYTWDSTDEICAAWYEIGFGAALHVGDDHLDEMFAATLVVDAGNVATFVLDIPIQELRGSLRPKDFDDSAASLRIEGDFMSRQWQGEMGWLGALDGYEAWEDIGAFSFGMEPPAG